MKTTHQYDASIEDVPHHALVYYSRMYCSGSLVSSRTIVTCAACFFKRETESVFARVGTENYMENRTPQLRVLEIKIHEFYRRLTPVDNDIALIFLERSVKFSKAVLKIPLAEPDVPLRIDNPIYVSGYGGDNVPSKFKNRVLVTTITLSEDGDCDEEFSAILSNSNYCGRLSLPAEKLSDNGGGATVDNVLVGILVTGATNSANNSAIFTNVSYFHRWIVLNTVRFHEKYCNDTNFEISIESYET